MKKLSDAQIELDLGGIGKGFALDKMVDILREWDIDTAFLHGGTSSLFAMDAPHFCLEGWPITLSNEAANKINFATLKLTNISLSGSGMQKGEHILDPRTGQPVAGKLGAWSLAQSATFTDALSTTFMIFEPDEMDIFCGQNSETGGLVLSENGDSVEQHASGIFLKFLE